MCRCWWPLCHGSRLVRALRAIEAETLSAGLVPGLPCQRRQFHGLNVRSDRGFSSEVVVGVKRSKQWHSSGPRRRAQSSARARRRDGRNGNGCSGGNALNVPLDSLLASVKLALAVAPMGVGALGLRQPSLSCLRSWAEPVVAAGLRAGLPELHLARLSLYWRLGNCPPTAARPAPCRIGKPALRGL
jgi:hypothetical protein